VVPLKNNCDSVTVTDNDALYLSNSW